MAEPVPAFAPALLDDPRFATMRDRDVNGEALGPIFDEAVASLTTAEALQRMVDNDVPGARVVRRDEVADDAQVIHNESLVRLDDGPIGARIEARPPVSFNGDARAVPAAAPALGADTVAVWHRSATTTIGSRSCRPTACSARSAEPDRPIPRKSRTPRRGSPICNAYDRLAVSPRTATAGILRCSPDPNGSVRRR